MRIDMANFCKNIGVYVGRFQPLNNAHLNIIVNGLANEDLFIIILITDNECNDKNPFSPEIRKKFIVDSVMTINPSLLIKLSIAELHYDKKFESYGAINSSVINIINQVFCDSIQKNNINLKYQLYLYGSHKDRFTNDIKNNTIIKMDKFIELISSGGVVINSTEIREKMKQNNFKYLPDAVINIIKQTHQKEFRNYELSDRHAIVKNFYYLNHTNQTVELVRHMKKQYINLSMGRMPVWDAIMKLDQIIDNSDPDLALPQSVHCFQTAEMIRKNYPSDDWFQLVGLIHDCGKVLMLPNLYGLPDYLVVGDTFPVGCKWSEKIVHYDLFQDNPDSRHAVYQTRLGIYKENIGFDNVMMSWSHDEYLYQVCIKNKCSLPPEALYIIRYHSFYSQHQNNAYDYLTNEKDVKLMPFVKKFQQFDLYSKDNSMNNFIVTPEMKQYYMNLIEKYFPAVCFW